MTLGPIDFNDGTFGPDPTMEPAARDAMVDATTDLGDDYDLHPHTAARVATALLKQERRKLALVLIDLSTAMRDEDETKVLALYDELVSDRANKTDKQWNDWLKARGWL